MATQLERRTATRTRLLEAAMASFRERGYTATRNVDVAGAAGVTIGALYHHFRDKEDLFLQALLHGQRQRADWYDLPRRFEPTTPLRDIVTAALAELATNVGAASWTPVIADFWYHAGHKPDVREQLATIYRAWVDEIAGFVRTLQDCGWVDAERDATILATHIYSLGAGAQTMSTLYEGGEPATLADAIAAILTG